VLKTLLVSTLKVLTLVHAMMDFKEMELSAKILTSAQLEVIAMETPPVSTTLAALSARVTAVSMEQDFLEIVLNQFFSVLTMRILTVAMPTPIASTRQGPTCASAWLVSKVMVTRVPISLVAPISTNV